MSLLVRPLWNWVLFWKVWFGLWCLTLLSTLFQLSRGEVWCRWRFSYQEGRFGAVGDSVIKRGGLVPLEIQLSRGGVWNPINGFNPTTFLCLSQTRTWISNVICHGLFCVQWVQLRQEVIVDIGGTDDHHCLNFLFIIPYMACIWFNLKNSFDQKGCIICMAIG